MRTHHVSGITDGRTARAASPRTLLAIALIAFGFAALAARAQAAVSIEYPNFSSANVSALQLNGAAAVVPPALQLTPAKGGQQSSAFYTTTVDPSQAWSTQFEISMSKGSPTPADGIVFVLQNDPRGATALAKSTEGGSLGFSGINPSLGLEFDIYDLNPGDPPKDHIGIIENGNTSKYVECATAEAIVSPCDKTFSFPLYSETSKPVFGWMTYDGASKLTVYASNEATKPATPLLQVEVNLGSLLGKSAFAGFTAATGSFDAIQQVLNWNFSGTPGGEGPPSKGPPPSNNGLNGTVTQVICNLVIATASDTCTATVGDAALSGKTNPIGTVKFVSTNGGVFSAGNTCNLVPTPFSGSTSSCSVQFLPPTNPSSFPAITASFLGDAHHNPSAGQTSYGSASELTEHVELSQAGTVTQGETVQVPIGCGFPCGVNGELGTGTGLGESPPGYSFVLHPSQAVIAKKKHGKKKQKTTKSVLGTGSLALAQPGKGTLVIKLTPKAKRALKKAKGKSFKATLTVTIKTAGGTLVGTKTEKITIRPAKASKHKGRHGKHH
jgi:Legume lectin domain